MKAIITAAGLGTRFAPVTRVVPKEMLPIGSRPALELLVEEARGAGVDGIMIVISPEKELIRAYFAAEPDIDFVYQNEQLGLGHAVLQARVDDDVLVILGDAIVVGCSAAAEMAEVRRRMGAAGVVGLERVPRERVSRYGIAKCGSVDARARTVEILDLVEKPSAEEAPSDLAVAGRYILPKVIFDRLAVQKPGKNGEIQLTDSIASLAREGGMFGYIYPGRRLDIGNPDGYYEALTAMRSGR